MSFWAKLPQNEEAWQNRTVIDGLDGRYQFNLYRRNDDNWEISARGQLYNLKQELKFILVLIGTILFLLRSQMVIIML